MFNNYISSFVVIWALGMMGVSVTMMNIYLVCNMNDFVKMKIFSIIIIN